jgi:hypothetical protein
MKGAMLNWGEFLATDQTQKKHRWGMDSRRGRLTANHAARTNSRGENTRVWNSPRRHEERGEMAATPTSAPGQGKNKRYREQGGKKDDFGFTIYEGKEIQNASYVDWSF